MTLSLYSFVMAALWFTVFILLGAFLQRKVGFVFCYHLTPLLLLLAVTVFRMVIAIELHLTVEVPFTSLYPVVQDFLQATLITVGGRGGFRHVSSSGAMGGCGCFLVRQTALAYSS